MSLPNSKTNNTQSQDLTCVETTPQDPAYEPFLTLTRGVKQWVYWKLLPKPTPTDPDHMAKAPFDPATDRKTSYSDQDSWMTYDEARKACLKYGGSGVGFVLGGALRLIVVDLDDCFENGVVKPWAMAIIERLNSYTEVSQSGTGIHIWLWGELPTDLGSNRKEIETYQKNRFIAFTGQPISDITGTVQEHRGVRECDHAVIDVLYEFLGKKPEKLSITKREGNGQISPYLDDEGVIRHAVRAKNGAKFTALFTKGDISEYDNDHSVADMALVRMLAFYTQDEAQIDRLFQSSSLYRSKWGTRPDYQEGTIAKVLDTLDNIYNPNHQQGTTDRNAPRKRFIVDIRADQVRAEKIDWMMKGYLPFGTLSLVAGQMDRGKSVAVIGIVAAISAGLPMPITGEKRPPAHVVYLAAEDSAKTMLVPRLIAAGANLSNISFFELREEGDDFEDTITIPGDLQLLQEKMLAMGTRLVVFDPILSYLDDSKNAYSDHQMKRTFSPVSKMGEVTGAAMLGILHLNKNEKITDPLNRIGGSIGIPATARSVLMFDFKPGGNENQRVMALAKGNMTGKMPSIVLRLEGVLVDDRDTKDIETVKAVFEGTINLSAAELLNNTGGESKHSAAAEARQFLIDELKDKDWVTAFDLEVAAKANDLSWSTVKAEVNKEKKKQFPLFTSKKETGVKDGKWRYRLLDIKLRPELEL